MDRAMTTLSLPLTGIHCAGCVNRAEKALNAVGGVTGASVNLATRVATVTIDDATTAGDLATALKTAGYPVAQQEARLTVEGLISSLCAISVMFMFSR